MNNKSLQALLILLVLIPLGGCRGGGATWPGLQYNAWKAMEQSRVAQDREAILKMAGTFKVSFDFEETLPMREGYELAKPYQTEAEELVIVVENTERFISLQHLLVVRHEGETHVINHWRQDWAYVPERMFRWHHDMTWKFSDCDWDSWGNQWVQLVYNVADSPRYGGIGFWRHDHGRSTWTGSHIARPLPLRESSHREDYNELRGTHRIVVNDYGWLHLQDNVKRDASKGGPRVDSLVALEMGVNQYLRVPDENFEKAHEYWKNTEPFWKEVRSVWAEVFEDVEYLALRKKWKGDPLFSHLFGLADEYWGQADVSEARPRIEEVIDAFVVEDE